MVEKELFLFKKAGDGPFKLPAKALLYTPVMEKPW